MAPFLDGVELAVGDAETPDVGFTVLEADGVGDTAVVGVAAALGETVAAGEAVAVG
ncbi:hypothetical protein D3C85_1711010 [compost metagenome]